MSQPVRVRIPRSAIAALTWLAEQSADDFDVLSRELGEPAESQNQLAARIRQAMADAPTGCEEALVTELLRLLRLRFAHRWKTYEIAEKVSDDSQLVLSDEERTLLQERLITAMSNHKLVRMARAHEARRRSRMRRTWKLGSGLSKGIAATVALAAGAVGVLAYLGWNPFASTPPPAAGVVDRILAESDSYKAPAQLIAPLEAQMQNTCTSETVNGPQSAAMKCWLSLAGFYSGSAQFRLTISAIDRAQEINTRIADPYYLLGATYWDMIMFDLVKTGNYRIVNPQQLIVNLFPDADSVALAHLAAQQLQEAQGLPYIDINSPPKNVGTISQADIAETQDQISTINNGATVLQPGPNSMPIFLDILAAVYPHNKEVTSEFVIMGQSLFNEMKAHPDQFPGLPPGV